MATATWPAAGVVTTTDGAEAVVIITDGPGAAVTAITGKLSLDSPSSSIARAIRELQRRERVAPTRRGRFSDHQTADRAQPSPISTAIRIKSE